MSSEGPGSAAPVLSVRGLGKCYHIYARPQDRLKQALWRWKRTYFREFWALRNVSFEVRPGESVGILGRNGSGKSTLLQMIAGTLAPTEGEVQVRGRVAALLELGSGFNLEFTGRENVFLNGAILGIPRREMERRFDEIAAFAEIGEFMEQPVKTYSSGMHARLAFSVAIAVEPEILILDEILAVGDIGFQQKCLARLRQMRERGLTLLFVSHSPDAVKSLCQRGVFLISGQTAYVGPAEQAVNLYYAHIREHANRDALAGERALPAVVPFRSQVEGKLRYGTGHVQLERVELLDADGAPCRAFRLGDPITVEAMFRAHADVRNVSVSFLVRDMSGVDLMGTTTFDERAELAPMRAGDVGRVRFRFVNSLRAGHFGVCVAVNRVSARDYSDVVLFDQVDSCAAFVVMADPDRPVHYKFHEPVAIQSEVLSHA